MSVTNTPTIIQKNTALWQKELAEIITDPKDLFGILHLDENHLAKAYEVTKLFPLRVTHSFITRMARSDINDPLLKQILPLDLELVNDPDFINDPLQEKQFNPVPGLLHKYSSRVLITLTGSCAIHCRYCFRRNFPYEENTPGTKGLEKIISYIRDNAEINEVILSGGDPLNANDAYLSLFISSIEKIPHIKTIRIHSRLPIVLPSRITNELLDVLTASQKKTVIVIHSNHPNEIDESVNVAIKKLIDAKIAMFNQSVLLKDINDDADILALLSEKLFEVGVIPYYLFLLDKVSGTKHFDVDLQTAKKIHSQLKTKLSGYLVPRLAKEIAGEESKSWA